MQQKKNFFRKISIQFLIVVFLLSAFLQKPASAAFTWTQTSYADFLGNTLTNIDITSVLGNATLSASSNSIAEEWTNNGVDISDTSNEQQSPQVISDGAGNAIITWFDTASDKIYAQKINSAGTVQWTSSGVAVSSRANPSNPQIVSDGAGGAIISWDEYQDATYTYNVYAQRLNSSGEAQWTAGGVAISTETNHQRYNKITSDGSNGAVITWEDFRNSSWNIFAQRINSSGTVQWTTNGVAITTSGSAGVPQIIYSDSGNVIISWATTDIYAQKLNSSGVAQWTAGGVVICNAANSQYYPKLVSDGAGGAIISWEDDRVNSSSTHMYAQKIDTDGAVQWTANGVILSPSYDHSLSQITTDGLGGAIVTWSANTNIYAQKINSSGQIPSGGSWVANGLIVTNGTGNQYDPKIVSDNSNGAIIAWHDENTGNYVYAQKINYNGEKFWSANGEIISSDLGYFEYLSLSSDGSGGAYVVWDDYADNVQLYAQDIRNTPNYPTAGTNTMLSSVYDAGAGISASFDNISWNTNLPANTNITFETRSAPDNTPTIWRDDFNDTLITNIIEGTDAFPTWDQGTYNTIEESTITEGEDILTVLKIEDFNLDYVEWDDYYLQIDTGQAAEYYPVGTVITARVKIITEKPVPTAYIYMFVDGWDVGSADSGTSNQWVELSYTTTGVETFNTIGFDIYELGHEVGYNDQFLIDWITVEPPLTSINWSDWSASYNNPAGNDISSPDGRYIQYRATFFTTDSSVTPTLYDVTITDVDSGFDNSLEGNVNIYANVDPTLTLNLSSTTCDLLIMSETDLKTCNYELTVNTNGSGGYTASIRQDNNFQSGANVITPVSGGVGTVTAGTEGYGYATSNATYISSGYYIPAHPDAGDCDSYNNQHATAAPVKALANTDAPIAQADGPVSAEITTICHAVAISGSTPAGTYSQNIKITVVGNF